MVVISRQNIPKSPAQIAAGVGICVLVVVVCAEWQTGAQRDVLEGVNLQLPKKVLATYPTAMKTLAGAAAFQIENMPHPWDQAQTFSLHRWGHRPTPGLAAQQQLTTDPNVAEYMFNNEMGNWDGTNGPDNGWVPYGENEPCEGGICFEQYNQYAHRRPGNGLLSSTKSARAGRGWTPTQLVQNERARDVHRHHVTLKSTQGRTQSLGLVDEAISMPEVNDDNYADFYRAYATYQLPIKPYDKSDPEGVKLPPHDYPYAEAYYPKPPPEEKEAGGGGGSGTVINANGAGSTNTFTVTGPKEINVENVISTSHFWGPNEHLHIHPPPNTNDAVIRKIGGWVYPDGRTPMSVPDRVEEARQRAAASGVAPNEVKQDCQPNDADCQFNQDASDFANY